MLPPLFVERMKNMLGREYEEFEACFDREKYQALRFNPLKGDKQQFLANNDFHLSPVAWSENGFYYEKEDTPGKHPYHEAGVYYIQEPSAQMPGSLLEARPGERVLDFCSAPGGKATQIAAAMQGKGLLVANEYVPGRAKILSENIERMGIKNALVINETPASISRLFPGFFHRIMVDAPCSGEGMFRKNEDAKNEWSLENVQLCADRQDEILDAAVVCLAPGGRIVYSTCTFAREEDEGSMERFMERHPDFQLLTSHRLWPHQIKGEGHFVAVLQRDGELNPGSTAIAATGLNQGIKIQDCREFLSFIKDTLAEEIIPMDGTFIRFGDQLYLAPEGMPGLKGMKVLRPGLHLGTILKNRFEPSHALALSLKKEEVKNAYELQTMEAAGKFVAGNTFPAEGEKGWYLITIHGYSIGWGKLAGGIMKNHYPKGLRKIVL